MFDNKEADYTEWMIRDVYMDVSILNSNCDYLSVVNDWNQVAHNYCN